MPVFFDHTSRVYALCRPLDEVLAFTLGGRDRWRSKCMAELCPRRGRKFVNISHRTIQ